MKKPQLYIKNDKGRYEPYVEEKKEDYNTLYTKRGNKYEPFALRFNDDYLTDGVYVVRRHFRGSARSLANAEHLSDVFCLEQVSKNYRITTDQMASLEDYTDFCIEQLRKSQAKAAANNFGMSEWDKVQNIIGNVFNFSTILKEKIEKEKSIVRDTKDDTPQF